MSEKSLTIRLFDPGMTHLHRVGLAGLYMTLKALEPSEYKNVGEWILEPKKIELRWHKNPKEFLAPLIKHAFGISSYGSIEFLAHRDHGMGDLERILLHRALLTTFLQHGQTRKLKEIEQELIFEYDSKRVIESIKPIISYQNQNPDKLLFTENGNLRLYVKLAGWLFPGGGVRHVAFLEATSLTATPEKLLALIFAPVASLFFLLSHRNRDGKYDSRRRAALVLPHITDLEDYQRCYTRYLTSPVQRLYADGMGDAGLTGLTCLQAFKPDGMIENLDIASCTIITFGTMPWAKQQKTRTGLQAIKNIDTRRLNFFSLVLRTLKNRTRVTDEGKLIFFTSLIRGLIAENIAAGREWFRGFTQLMSSKALARLVSFERRELKIMVEKAEWSYEADRLLVEAIHQALSKRYGALAQRAREKGEVPQFGREFERLRTSLMRTKNGQTFRAELADIFARGGVNQTLQKNWTTLLPLFTGENWQRAKDLALLAIASYSGRGAEVVEKDLAEEEEAV